MRDAASLTPLHGRECQSKPFTRLAIPHDGLSPDLTLLDEKIEPSSHSHGP
jgi:hypothetical protein